MSKERYLEHRGYRANKEHGSWVWSKKMKKKLAGIDPSTGKRIMVAKSGLIGDGNNMRVITNTDDYDLAKSLLDNRLRKPKKAPKTMRDPGQVDLMAAIREAEK